MYHMPENEMRFSPSSYKATNCPQSVRRVSRSLGVQLVARGGGDPAQLSPLRNLPSASPPTRLRYLQRSNVIICCDSTRTVSGFCVQCRAALCIISVCALCLQSLIPDIRPSLGQEAIVDLHPEEAVLSGIEDEERERSDQDLQIRRTVTQVDLQLPRQFCRMDG